MHGNRRITCNRSRRLRIGHDLKLQGILWSLCILRMEGHLYGLSLTGGKRYYLIHTPIPTEPSNKVLCWVQYLEQEIVWLAVYISHCNIGRLFIIPLDEKLIRGILKDDPCGDECRSCCRLGHPAGRLGPHIPVIAAVPDEAIQCNLMVSTQSACHRSKDSL